MSNETTSAFENVLQVNDAANGESQQLDSNIANIKEGAKEALSDKRYFWAIVVGCVLACIGVGFVIFKWVMGEQVTGLSSLVIWGIEAAGIYTLAACGCGLLAYVSIRELIGGISNKARSLALAASIASFLATGALVLFDLSNPINIFDLIIAGAISSFMTWDFYLLLIATCIAIAYFVVARSENPSNKGLAVCGIVIACLVVIIEAMMTTSILGREVWANGLTIVGFLIGAALLGAALASALNHDQRASRVASVSAGLLLICMFSELLATSNIEIVISSPFLWLGAIGLAAACYLCFINKFNTTAAACAVFGVLCEKTWVLAYGQATHLFSANTPYVSSPTEWFIVLGAIGIAIVVYEILAKAISPKTVKE